jgi:ketosteroid isomerase-like protein
VNKKLKESLIFVFLTLGLLSPVRTLLAEDSSEKTQQVIRALFEAFNRHDTAALVALYSEDARILSPGDIEPRIGPAAVREIYDAHFDNIPGVHDAVQKIIADGTQGSVEFVASWDQPTEDDPGARETLRIAAFITVKDGLIIQDISYFDRMELAQKMDTGD